MDDATSRPPDPPPEPTDTDAIPLFPEGLGPFGRRIHLHPSVALLVPVVAAPWLRSGREIEMTAGLTVGLLAIASVLAHEVAHAVAARWMGGVVDRIELHALGGRCVWRGDPGRRQRAVIASAGPAANLLLAGGFWLLSAALGSEEPGAWLPSVARMVALLNLTWAAYNLLPMGRSDGATLLALAASEPRHRGAGRRVSRVLRWAVVVSIAALAFAAGHPWIGLAIALLGAFGGSHEGADRAPLDEEEAR